MKTYLNNKEKIRFSVSFADDVDNIHSFKVRAYNETHARSEGTKKCKAKFSEREMTFIAVKWD